MPGTLTSRVTATSNAVFTGENMFMWNVLPPCAATVAAIALVCTVSLPMAARLALVAGVMVVPDVPARRRRPAAAPRLRQQGRSRRRRNGRRRRQYAAGAGVRRLPARAPPLRRHRRARNGRAPAQPASIWKSCASFTPSSPSCWRSACSPGRSCCGSKAKRRPATSCSSARSACRCCTRRATSRWRWSTSPSISRASRRRWRRCWCRTSCATIPRRRRWSAAAPA